MLRPAPALEGTQQGTFRFVAGTHKGERFAIQNLLAEAHWLYQQDTDPGNPNIAPLAFWPSCHAYRQAMGRAADRSGLAAEALLTEIPDPDLALLASIEMAAGILGLPEYNGGRMEQHLKR
jgi:hypothetical protein